MEVLLREFRRQDLDALFFLEQRCYPEPYRFRFDQLLSILLDKNVITVVAESPKGLPASPSMLAGGMILRVEPFQQRLVLITLMVSEALRRQGLGRRLLETALTLGRQGRHSELLVPVEKENPNAGAFLAACGLQKSPALEPFFTRPEEGAVWRMEFETPAVEGT
ncbi:MAG: GNAT family N-acetyltransferase [Deltaproteobacteria bacterium]|nr:GNAT family N-acetyltransferase [Deltaproteobacteria bacterium]